MADVVKFNGYTSLPIDPDGMLQEIDKADDIEHAVVIVRRKDGDLTLHGSSPDKRGMEWMLGQILHGVHAGWFT